ncbi:hypothetical protein EUX98_g2075 [Antrodiella citrinella]|uniref:Rhodopsin n=1 Tax=Antrodiella citrinella TaxID=2447956 RepID=A0A4S4MZX9_9APHY|nr:hypothetical protein EUX98_g2075 [Antrodiella citrinella]
MAGPLSHNPPNASRHITDGAIAWLWVVYGFFLTSTILMIIWQFTRPRGTRFFHNLAVIVLTTSTLAYFSMASDLGATPIFVEFLHSGGEQTRQIWYVRYIQYFINFPILLAMLQFASGLALSDILITGFFAWFVVVCGLVGALVASIYKWGYFVMGVFGLIYIWASLDGHGPRTTFSAGDVVRTGYIRASVYLTLVTLMYPLVWGLSEGGNVLSPSGEMVWYGILDLLLGPLFLFFFLSGLRTVDYETFGFRSGKYTDGYGADAVGTGAAAGTGAAVGSNAAHTEKPAVPAATSAADAPAAGTTSTAPTTAPTGDV